MKRNEYIFTLIFLLLNGAIWGQDLVLTFNTQIDDPASSIFTLPITGGAYDVDMDNNGSYEDFGDFKNVTGNKDIMIGTLSDFTIRIRPNISNTGNELSIAYANGNRAQKLVRIESWGSTIVWTSMANAFQGCTSMTISASAGAPNLSMVTDMSSMFQGATSFNGDISSWNISNVTNMTDMFSGTTSFTRENYNKLLNYWSLQEVNPNVTLGAPPVTYCDDNAGRNRLTSAPNNWSISGDTSEVCEGAAFTFDTRLGTGGTTITLPMSGGTYDVDTDNNGSFDVTDQQNTQIIDLGGVARIQTIRIRPNPTSNASNLLRIAYNDANDAEKLTSIDNWGTTIVWTSMDSAFQGCSNMNIAASAGEPNLSSVTSMAFMFAGAEKLNQDLSGWNVSTVTNMQAVFFEASIFDGNVSTWNVSNVTNMGYTFGLAPKFDQPLNNWNVSKVTAMTGMFQGAALFNQSLNTWNTSSVTLMNSMFSSASVFDQDLNNWDVSKVISMNNMFQTASKFNGNISTWNTASVTGMSFMFINAALFDQPLNSWNVSKVTNMSNMFNGAIAFNQDLNSWNTSSVIFMNVMFGGASKFNGNISNWNTSNVTDMSYLFFNTPAFNQNIGNWNVENVTTTAAMFHTATLFDQDLSGWNVSNATEMNAMFTSARAFNRDLSSWNVSKVTLMNNMFQNTDVFNGNISTWNTSSVTDMDFMFVNATAFNQDLSTWNISNVAEMTAFLSGANSFSSENYDNLLVGWAAQSVQQNVVFGAPPTSYCLGKEERKILTDPPNNWQITGDTESCSDFILTYNTTAEGDANSTTISLLILDGTYDVDLDNDGDFTDTGDGGALVNFAGTGVETIDLGTPGEHTIRIRPNPTNNTNNQLRIRNLIFFAAEKLIRIENWGNTIVWTSMSSAFTSCSNLTIAIDAGIPNLNMVTDMSSMFLNATSMDYDFNAWDVSKVTNMSKMFSGATGFTGNISSWNTENVTDMSHMFQNATAFNGDITGWNTSNVTSMRSMFNATTSFNRAIGSWDVSNVTDMAYTFSGNTIFNQPLNAWNVSNVTDMAYAFSGAIAFNKSLSSWNVSKVTSMGNMFDGASIFNQDLNSWNTVSVTYMRRMFRNATDFNQDVSGWNVALVTNMQDMFSGISTYSRTNYDKLLISWSSQSVRSNVEFGAPPANYCDGAAGRDLLDRATDGGKNWNISGDLAQSCPDLTLTFNTTLGDPGNTTIMIPMIGDSAFSYDVDIDNDGDFTDVGDGGALTNQSGTITIDFGIGNGGEKTIRIRPNSSNTNNQLRIAYANGNSGQKLLRIDNWGDVIVWTSMEDAFHGCANLDIPVSSGAPNLSIVTSLKSMFENATAFNGDINGWNTSNVTDMSYLFKKATTFNQNLNSWNTSNVTTISYMFDKASAFNQPLNNWNTSKVTLMSTVFSSASVFNQDLTNWDTSNVTIMADMFYSATVFNGNINNWNTANVTDMDGMFGNTTTFNRDISSWDTGNVVSMELMFYNTTVFNQPLNSWNVAKVTSMDELFYQAAAFNQDLNSWNVENVIDMSNVFEETTAFNGNISNWNTSNVTNMNSMFSSAAAFNQDISTWNVTKVTSMRSMFSSAGAFNQDISTWNIVNVSDFTSFLRNVTSFSSGNYDKMLTVWSSLNVQNNIVSFGEPLTTYCVGEAGRNALIADRNWSFNNGATKACSDFIVTFNTELGAPGNATIMLPMATGEYDVDINNDGVYGGTDFATVPISLDGLTGTKTITFASPGIYTIRIRPSASNPLHIRFAGSNDAQKLTSIDYWDNAIVWSSMESAFEGCINMTQSASAGAPNLSIVTDMSNMFQNASTFNTDISSWNVATVTNMTNFMTGATSFSPENYGSLLTAWSAVTTQTNVAFGAPPTTYCAGTAGRIVLTNLNWTITGDISSCPEMVLSFNSNATTIILPIIEGAYDVDFNNDAVYGDTDNGGKTLDNLTGTHTITFASSGSHTIRIRPNPNNNPNNELRIAYAGSNDGHKVRTIQSWGTIVWTSMEQAFQGCPELSISATAGNPDLSMVTNMSRMFLGAYNFDSNINSWNVSNVTDMSYMFGSGFYNQPLNNWNVSSVTNMGHMFDIGRGFNQDISMWNTSNVTDMSAMFKEAQTFNLNIASWDVSKVTTMHSMFDQASKFNQDLSSWNISLVTAMDNLLRSTSFSSENYDKLLIKWSELTVRTGINITIPATYCAGSGGKTTLEDTYSWTFNDSGSTCTEFAASFQTTEGDPGSRTITLPMSDGAYDVDINFDGIYNDFDDTGKHLVDLTGTHIITFASGGGKSIHIRPSSSNITRRLRITYAGANNAQKLLQLADWGNSIVWTSMANAFQGCTNFSFFGNPGAPNLSVATDLSFMFSGAGSMGNVSDWDVSTITNMQEMFAGSNFNRDLSTWDTSNVTNMKSMFSGVTAFNSNISSWNTSNVTKMNHMFNGAAAFNQDINSWNVSKVNDMFAIFYNAIEFNQNLNSWNVSSVTVMESMFNGASKFNGNISSWNTSNATTMSYMFTNAAAFNADISGWNTSKVTNMNSIFSGASIFNQNLNTWDVSKVNNMFGAFKDASLFNGNISGWNVENVTSMTLMFENASLFNVNLSSWNVSKVTSMNSMFLGASVFNGNISAWNTSSVTGMASMFNQANAFNQDISGWNVSNVTLMNAMFSQATVFNQDLSNWNVSKVIAMGNMFQQTGAFNGNISTWNTSSVTDNMGFMFQGATAFNQDISGWNVSGAANMASMFNGATKFNQDLSLWNTGNVTDMTAMFSGATDFNGNVSTWNTGNVTNMSYMFSSAAAFNQDVGSWNVSNVVNMAGMFNATTSFSKTNYDSLLTGWGSRAVQPNVPFHAPPTPYCTGKDGIEILKNATNMWVISNDLEESCEVLLSVKMFLHGAYDTNTGMMKDNLRSMSHIPMLTPHADAITANASVLIPEGNDAIVDWVYVELRDKNDITNVLYGVSGLLQRDGDIVSMDGTSVLSIAAAPDDYYVSVNHRNHLAIATDVTHSLISTTTSIDLTVSTNVRGGGAFMHEISAGVHAAVGGDFDGDEQITTNDLISGFGAIGLPGYRLRDADLNGQVNTNDITVIVVPYIGTGKQF